MVTLPAEIRDEVLGQFEFGDEDFTIEAWVRFDRRWEHVGATHHEGDGGIVWFRDGIKVIDPKPTYGMPIGRRKRRMRV